MKGDEIVLGKRSFARWRYHSLLVTQMIASLMLLISEVVGLVVAGSVVGVDALSGVAVVAPVLIGSYCLGRLVSNGSSYMFSKYQGACDSDGAQRTVGVALETGIALGVVIFLAMHFGRDLYFDAVGISGAVREQAALYWRWIIYYAMIQPVAKTLWRMVYADGEVRYTIIGDMMYAPLSVTLSIILAKVTGDASGVSLGLLIATLASDSLLIPHFFRKSNAVIPKWNLSLKILNQIFVFSLPNAGFSLCQCGILSVVNKLVMLSGAIAYLPVVGMFVLFQHVNELLLRLCEAYIPVVEMYKGEGNLGCMRDLARHAMRISAAAGTAAAAVLCIFAPGIVSLYGLPPGILHEEAVRVIRICSLALPMAGALSFLAQHYLVLNRIPLSIINSVLRQLLIPGICLVVCCRIWGVRAMWFGIPAGYLLTVFIAFLHSRLVEKKKNILLLKDEGLDLPIMNLSYPARDLEITQVRDACAQFLREHGADDIAVARIMLLIEECSMMISDINRAADKVTIETSVYVNVGKVTIVFRDTGITCDLTDADAKVIGVRSFVLSGLVQSCDNRRYLNTVGCNRAVFETGITS